jgi:hypothetical protein
MGNVCVGPVFVVLLKSSKIQSIMISSFLVAGHGGSRNRVLRAGFFHRALIGAIVGSTSNHFGEGTGGTFVLVSTLLGLECVASEPHCMTDDALYFTEDTWYNCYWLNFTLTSLSRRII